MKNLSVALKKEIIKGGIVLSPRRSGKTRAALSLLLSSEDYVLVCITKQIARELQIDLLNMGKTTKCIYGPKDKIPEGKKVIVDEFFYNAYCLKNPLTEIHCLMATAPKNLVVFNTSGGLFRTKAESVWKNNKK